MKYLLLVAALLLALVVRRVVKAAGPIVRVYVPRYTPHLVREAHAQ
jgi:hypothetical protein